MNWAIPRSASQSLRVAANRRRDSETSKVTEQRISLFFGEWRLREVPLFYDIFQRLGSSIVEEAVTLAHSSQRWRIEQLAARLVMDAHVVGTVRGVRQRGNVAPRTPGGFEDLAPVLDECPVGWIILRR